MYVVSIHCKCNGRRKYRLIIARSGQIGWALSYGPKGPGSRLAWQNTAMYTNGTWCIQNQSWVQCPLSFQANYASEGKKAGKPSPAWWIKIVMACLRIIHGNESQNVGNKPLRSFSPTLNPNNSTQHIDLKK